MHLGISHHHKHRIRHGEKGNQRQRMGVEEMKGDGGTEGGWRLEERAQVDSRMHVVLHWYTRSG